MYWLPYSSDTFHYPSQTPCLHWISYATQKLMLYSRKMVEKQSEVFHTFLWHFFTSLNQNFIAYHSSSNPDCIFEIHLLWQSGFSSVYSNSCCSCSFEPEIIKIDPPSHKMYSNDILNFQASTTILNTCTKKSETYWRHRVNLFLPKINLSKLQGTNQCRVTRECLVHFFYEDFVCPLIS